jgi:hypothetical protein
MRVIDADSDDDGVRDGSEDRDRDGVSNEDEDDQLRDRCNVDRDHDGVADEDEGDLLGTVVSFDETTRQLAVDTANGVLRLSLTDDTEIDIEHSGREGSTADLVPGARVSEVDVDDKTGALEEIQLFAAASPTLGDD